MIKRVLLVPFTPLNQAKNNRQSKTDQFLKSLSVVVF